MKLKAKGGFPKPAIYTPRKPKKATGKLKPGKPVIGGGFAPGPTPAPATPGAPGGGLPPVGTPNDARYAAETNALTRNYNDTSLALANRETGIRSDFGFDSAYANNPYTKANLLARSAQQRYTGSTNSFAGRGQLYSGALDRQRSADEFTSGQELDTARRSYEQQLAEIAQSRLQNQRALQEGQDTARLDLLDRLASQEPDSSLYDPDAGGGGGGGGKPKGGKPPKKGAPKKPKKPLAASGGFPKATAYKPKKGKGK